MPYNLSWPGSKASAPAPPSKPVTGRTQQAELIGAVQAVAHAVVSERAAYILVQHRTDGAGDAAGGIHGDEPRILAHGIGVDAIELDCDRIKGETFDVAVTGAEARADHGGGAAAGVHSQQMVGGVVAGVM